MKKLLAIGLILGFILAFAGCGINPPATENTPTGSNAESSAVVQSSPSSNTEGSIENSGSASSNIPVSISNSAAKQIALNSAGVSADQIYDYDIELDFENGIKVWEIDFEVGNVEYEYTINAQTGQIIHSNKSTDY